jgi:hypothetical protein
MRWYRAAVRSGKTVNHRDTLTPEQRRQKRRVYMREYQRNRRAKA